MAKYKKKPVIIDAMKFTWDNYPEVRSWMQDLGAIDSHFGKSGKDMIIKTLEGNMIAANGDWIIRGIKGEFYPCKPDIFDATYESVEG